LNLQIEVSQKANNKLKYLILPAKRKANNERTTENTGVVHIDITLPVSSGLNSSMLVPLATTIS
jgi:hypothetical protein